MKNLRAEAALKAQELVKRIPISMGADRSGFLRLSRVRLTMCCGNACLNCYLKWASSLKSVISLKVPWKRNTQRLMMSSWETIGLQPIDLAPGTYTFLFGDLGNRTSINVTDASGKPVEEELLKSMVPVYTRCWPKPKIRKKQKLNKPWVDWKKKRNTLRPLFYVRLFISCFICPLIRDNSAPDLLGARRIKRCCVGNFVLRDLSSELSLWFCLSNWLSLFKSFSVLLRPVRSILAVCLSAAILPTTTLTTMMMIT